MKNKVPNIITKDTDSVTILKNKKIGYWLKLSLKIVFFAHLVFIGIITLLSIIYINNNPSRTLLMFYRQGLEAQKPSFVPLIEIPSTIQMDLINLEDAHFRTHYGIDIEAIKRAMKRNEKVGKTAQGGSTITQQLARTLFLTPHRTYFRKYLELIIAFELELILGKDRILELYINYAELGKGIYGFNDAALHYYKKSFVKTSNDQKFRMMAILASPINYTPKTLHKNKTLTARYQFIYKWHKKD